MSDIRGLEPQAHGLIIFKTTFGDLELELFTQQCPKNTRNFTQLCLDRYYEGTIFDRVEKDFIAIGGKEPEKVEGQNGVKFDIAPDEFHSRLKFSRRGLLATANTEKNSNGPTFFFTLGAAAELQNKHTIFGRLKGDSVYHLVDLNECPVDDDMIPISEKKIIEVVVVENPYPDLKQRPSFVQALSKLRNKHENKRPESSEEDNGDYLEPKFDIKNAKKLSFYNDDSDIESSDSETNCKPESEFKVPESPKSQDDAGPSEGEQSTVEEQSSTNEEESKSSEDAREKRLREIKEQMRKFKRELELQSATKIRTLSERKRSSEDSQHNTTLESKANSSKQSSIEDPDLTAQETRLATKKGRQRERETLELMEKFKKKLKATTKSSSSLSSAERNDGAGHAAGPQHMRGSDDDEGQHLNDELALVDGDDWLRHRFDAETSEEVLAKDANTKGDDWYSIDDPRNPMMNRIETERARDYKSSRSRRREKDHDERDEEDGSRHRHRHRHHDSHSGHRHHRSSSSHRSKSSRHR